MSAAEVFFDTSGLLALLNRRDSFHERAIAVRNELVQTRATFVTSDWVLAEFLGGAAKQSHRAAAIGIVGSLRRSTVSYVLPASRSWWDQSFELFKHRPDKGWSLIDCTTIVACKERGIESVFAHDHHFAQAGFSVLL